MEILNRHHLDGPWPAGSLYVGRGTPLGNPFAIGENGLSRADAINAYGRWLEEEVAGGNPVILTALAGLNADSSLVCSCSPRPCHAEEVARVWHELQVRGGIRPMPSFHEDGSLPKSGEVWSFGSNLAGRHGAGSALVARERFGAILGQGIGYQGTDPAHSYAIPSKDEKIASLPVPEIERHAVEFVAFAHAHPELHFFVTRVGCGLAGHKDADIAPLFSRTPMPRCSFPEPWRPFLVPRSMSYAGIGARKTPTAVLSKMRKVAERLEIRGYRLRSGGAEGADAAFEEGCRRQDIFLPWPEFNGRTSPFSEVSQEAMGVASTAHPFFSRLPDQTKRLMARSSYQGLGQDLRTPADFVVCWTPDGAESEAERTRETGGTGQAIALASRWNIPVFNLARSDAMDRLAALVLAE